MSLKLNVLVVYPAHVVWLSSTKRKKGYSVNHRYIWLEFLPDEVTKLGVQDGDLAVDGEHFLLRVYVLRCGAFRKTVSADVPDRCAKRGHHGADEINFIPSEIAKTGCWEWV